MKTRGSLIVAGALLATQAFAAPAITFDAKAVTVSGLTPGAKVAWFSIARERPDWITNVVRRDGIDAADAGGVLSIPFDAVLSANSAWAAVDLTTGDVATGTPVDTAWHKVSPSSKAAAAGSAGSVGLIQDDRQFLELLLVRPGAGAWSLSVGDGGASDADGQPDGTIHAPFAGLRSVATSAGPPTVLRPGDVIVAIDPERAEVFSVRIGPVL